MKLSIIVPCYNEEGVVGLYYNEAIKYIKECNMDYELIFVNDGSSDNTISDCLKLKEIDKNVVIVDFSRNFGKEAAMYAGMVTSTGDLVVIMDVDLQDPPSLLPQMLEAILKEGYDCAATRRVTRKNEPPVRSFFARKFYKIMGKLSDVPVVDGARDFRLMTKKYKDAVLSLLERNRFTKGIFPWVGFKTKWFAYENVERVAGKTKWSFWKLFLYSIDGIIGFSTKPLAFSAVAGILSLAVSFVLIILIAVRRLVFGDPVQGWASLVCFITFFSGLQLFCTGISGLYISKIYTEVKHRPIYIIKEEK